jgi:hypothetical protein
MPSSMLARARERLRNGTISPQMPLRAGAESLRGSRQRDDRSLIWFPETWPALPPTIVLVEARKGTDGLATAGPSKEGSSGTGSLLALATAPPRGLPQQRYTTELRRVHIQTGRPRCCPRRGRLPGPSRRTAPKQGGRRSESCPVERARAEDTLGTDVRGQRAAARTAPGGMSRVIHLWPHLSARRFAEPWPRCVRFQAPDRPASHPGCPQVSTFVRFCPLPE